MPEPRLIVYSSLFPSGVQPTAGIFIRERMFRVARHIPIVVVSPQPWSPVDWLVRRFRSSFRPVLPKFERMDGIDVHRPRWLSLPGIGKRFDGWLMALCTIQPVRRLQRVFGATAIDAHFLYPDGWAATYIARRLGLPAVVTIRGSKDEWLIGTERERGLRQALARAGRVFAVSQALARNVAGALGVPAGKVAVIGNGVDAVRFQPVDRGEARRRLEIPLDAPVLIGVGNLVPGKGFQHVIAQLPRLRRRYPGLVYLIVGAGPRMPICVPRWRHRLVRLACSRRYVSAAASRRKSCAGSMVPLTSSCWRPNSKAGRTCFSKRWPAVCR